MEKAKDFSRKTVWPGSTQLAPVPVVLVGSGDGEKYPWNLVTIAWAGTVNSNPPMVSISVRPERHSFPAIRELGVFTVNIPPASRAKTVDWCGVVSGRDHDKIAEQHLTAVAGDKCARRFWRSVRSYWSAKWRSRSTSAAIRSFSPK